jgi:hypothetical protein
VQSRVAIPDRSDPLLGGSNFGVGGVFECSARDFRRIGIDLLDLEFFAHHDVAPRSLVGGNAVYDLIEIDSANVTARAVAISTRTSCAAAAIRQRPTPGSATRGT